MDKSIGDMKTMGGASEHGGYTLFEGDTLGQYRVIRALGRGGMGEVYEVEHTVLRRRYALKLLPDNFATHTGALERFQREAQVMAQLQHPHIVKVDEFGETDGRYWLRMECANGAEYGDGHITTLQDLAEAGKGRIGQETLAGILRQVLKALGHAHHLGVVHRDLKPSNILIFTDDAGSSFKIADFGLVRLVGEDWVRSQAQLTIQRSMSMGELRTIAGAGSSAGSSTRSMLGTFEYMSPEQKRGEDATAKSDVYAVGLMAYRLLTGRNVGPKPPSRIDSELVPGWDDFVEQALEEEPAERLGSAEEALTLLDGIDTDIAVNGGSGAVMKPVAARMSRTEPPALRERDIGPVEGENWISPTTDMEFLAVKAGSFEMGTPYRGGLDEHSVRTVQITRDFWVGMYEVTNSEYQRFLRESGYSGRSDADPDYLKHFSDGSNMPAGARHPVVCVSWNNAVRFCRWLTENELAAGWLPPGLVYRLPTEAEWEYAARGGCRSRETTFAGSDDINAVAWYAGNSRSKAYQVGAKAANELGVYDMSGNVWEWCHDWYQDSYSGLSTTNPTGPARGTLRVNRGGSWFNSDSYCRVAKRGNDSPSCTFSILGFRVFLGPPL